MKPLLLPILIFFLSGCISALVRMTDGRGYIKGKVTLPLDGSTDKQEILSPSKITQNDGFEVSEK